MTKYRAIVTETYEIEIDSEFDLDSDALYEEFKLWVEGMDDVINEALEEEMGGSMTVIHRNWDDIEEVVD